MLMRPVMMAAASRAEFVAAAGYSTGGASSSLTMQLPAATRAGDLALIWVDEGDVGPFQVASVAGGVGGWAAIYQSAAGDTLLWKVASAGDLATNLTVTGNGPSAFIVAIYHGATSVAQKSAFQGVSSPSSMSGFTRAAGHRGAVEFFGTSTNAATISVAGLVGRLMNTSNPSTPVTIAHADSVTGHEYDSGASPTWTWSGGATGRSQLYELT